MNNTIPHTSIWSKHCRLLNSRERIFHRASNLNYEYDSKINETFRLSLDLIISMILLDSFHPSISGETRIRLVLDALS